MKKIKLSKIIFLLIVLIVLCLTKNSAAYERQVYWIKMKDTKAVAGIYVTEKRGRLWKCQRKETFGFFSYDSGIYWIDIMDWEIFDDNGEPIKENRKETK